MNATERRRLLKLASFLDTLPRQKFDFSTVFRTGKKSPMAALAAGAHRCGTVGCAIGWAPAALPSLFKWRFYNDDGKRVVDCIVLRGAEHEYNFYAAAIAFGITESEARWLFVPNAIVGQFGPLNPAGSRMMHNVGPRSSPKRVARHIRKFVSEYPTKGEIRAQVTP